MNEPESLSADTIPYERSGEGVRLFAISRTHDFEQIAAIYKPQTAFFRRCEGLD